MSLYLIPRKAEPNKEGSLIVQGGKTQQVQYIRLYCRGPPGLLLPLCGMNSVCVSCVERSDTAHFNHKDITGLAFLVIARSLC